MPGLTRLDFPGVIHQLIELLQVVDILLKGLNKGYYIFIGLRKGIYTQKAGKRFERKQEVCFAIADKGVGSRRDPDGETLKYEPTRDRICS